MRFSSVLGQTGPKGCQTLCESCTRYGASTYPQTDQEVFVTRGSRRIRDRLQHVRRVVRWRIDFGTDLIQGEQLGRDRHQEGLCCSQRESLIEPMRFIPRMQDHGHAGVDLGDKLVRRSGENGKRRVRLA